MASPRVTFAPEEEVSDRPRNVVPDARFDGASQIEAPEAVKRDPKRALLIVFCGGGTRP